MNRFTVKICIVLAAAALGAPAVQANADPGLPPAAPAVIDGPSYAPESGSAGAYNSFMCLLHTMSAQVPCMYT
ncbi:hypothetical protein ACL02S_22440 [Nocardia sp. 004]|uniref:hypothetical protein n=1 Tax=Nocardia sp. 004 TaxID=3385978 RepID=UPI00399FF06E